MTAVRATVILQPTSLERLRETLDWAARLGYCVDVGGDYGVRSAVLCGERRWIRERTEGYVSPLGAVVLREQPRAIMMPEAAAEAMQVAVPWVIGFNDGSARVVPGGSWLAGFSADVYLAGYEAGVQVRDWIRSAYCAAHGCRYSRIGGACPSCEVAASSRGDEWPARGGES